MKACVSQLWTYFFGLPVHENENTTLLWNVGNYPPKQRNIPEKVSSIPPWELKSPRAKYANVYNKGSNHIFFTTEAFGESNFLNKK
jgi:hypothetical protein